MELGGKGGSIDPFQYEDLWYGLVFVIGYDMFYVLFLDRLGIHMYPVLLPRMNYLFLMWSAVAGGAFVFYQEMNDAVV